MTETKFNMKAIDSTFTKYSPKQVVNGFIVQKRQDGAIVNIGGKNDAFISKDEFDCFDDVKLGDSFDCMIINMKNENGFIEVSKRIAESFIDGEKVASKIKVGSKFSCVIDEVTRAGLKSKLGDFSIFIPASQVSSKSYVSMDSMKNQRIEVAAIEVDADKKNIIASKRILEEEVDRENSDNFFRAVFENKIVVGTVKKIMPYGAFVDVDGVDCFVHISEVSYERVNNIEDVLKVGQKYPFKVISVDRVEKKVGLSYKQTQPKPSQVLISKYQVGEIVEGEVIKLLAFGAIIKLENGATGMLHISKATTQERKSIHEIVHVGDKLQVEIIEKDEERNRLSFAIPNLKAGQ